MIRPETGIPILIRCGGITLQARLNDTESAALIAAAMPIGSEAGRWGEEVYFEIPVVASLAPDARDVLQCGEMGYWPPGRAFCIFWGRTPSSRGDEIRAASPVNVIGQVTDDARLLDGVRDGEPILVEKA